MNQMQSLLEYGRSLREFQNNTDHTVFGEAQTYPIFFDKHLMHPSRRIKLLYNDPNANIRAFYFQYLILCFEMDNPNFEFYIGKLNKFLLDPNFVFLFLEEDDENIFNDKQFKRFVFEFLEILDAGEFQSVEQALNKYPIIDIVFVYFFRSLAIYAELTNDFDSYIDKNIIFGFLLENFSIDAAIYQEKCLKFYEAEVFVYQENPQEIYMVYKEIEQTQSNHSKKQLSDLNISKQKQFSVGKEQEPKIIAPENEYLKIKDPKNQIIIDKQIPHSRNSSYISQKQSINQNISMLEQYEQGNNMSHYSHRSVFSRNLDTSSNMHHNKNSSLVEEGVSGIFNRNKIDEESESQKQESSSTIIKNNNDLSYLSHQSFSKSRPNAINVDKNKNIEEEIERSPILKINNFSDENKRNVIKDFNNFSRQGKNVEINDYTNSNTSDKLNIKEQQNNKNDRLDEYSLLNNKNAQHFQSYANRSTRATTIQHNERTERTSSFQDPLNLKIEQQSYHTNIVTTRERINQYEKFNRHTTSLSYKQSNTHQKIMKNEESFVFEKNKNTNENKYSSYARNAYAQEIKSTTLKENGNTFSSLQQYSYNPNIVVPEIKNHYKQIDYKLYPGNKYNPLEKVKQEQLQTRQFRASSNSIKQQIRTALKQQLNVSKQFTDSMTLMKMGEPYCSNIRVMKKRAREYRQSILKTFK